MICGNRIFLRTVGKQDGFSFTTISCAFPFDFLKFLSQANIMNLLHNNARYWFLIPKSWNYTQNLFQNRTSWNSIFKNHDTLFYLVYKFYPKFFVQKMTLYVYVRTRVWWISFWLNMRPNSELCSLLKFRICLEHTMLPNIGITSQMKCTFICLEHIFWFKCIHLISNKI